VANNRTDKCCYPSPYSPGKWVTAAQYITELICVRAAKKEDKDLPVKFWNIKKWRNYYLFQIKHCNRLLKEYDAKDIIRALKSDKGKRIHSLQASWFSDIIEEERKKSKPISTVITPTIIDEPKVRCDKPSEKSLLDKLRELEND
jgi:hypothetical protein